MLSKAAFILALFVAVQARAGDVRITIENVRSDRGSLMIGLYDTAEGFLAAVKNSSETGLLNDRSRVAGIALRAVAGPQTVVIGGLKPGRYAVITFHDENDDGKLGATPWGVPTEGYGFSNNAWAFLRAPSFEAAAFAVDEEGTAATTISLTYPPNSPPEDHSADKPPD
jgi:uncharacterized protein (DUF2141 family)